MADFKYTWKNRFGTIKTDIRGSEQEARDYVASAKGTFIGNATTVAPNYPTIALQPGSTNTAEVKKLQDYLVSQGLMTEAQKATGYGTYGPKTTAAVLALQKAKGVDYSSGPGYWGPKTLATVQGGTQTPQAPITPAVGQPGATPSVPATTPTTPTQYAGGKPPDDPSNKYNTATGQLNPNYSGNQQVPQSMVDTMGQVNTMIGNISQGIQELGGAGVNTPQTPIIPNVNNGAIQDSSSIKQAENQKKIDEAKALTEQANKQQGTIQDLTNQKTIADLQTALGMKPATPNFTSNYEALRSKEGVSALETRMNDLKAQKLALQDSLKMGLDKVSNKLEPLELISQEQNLLTSQAQNKINAIDRDLAQVQDEYNTKMNVISNLMQLQQTDYANAVNNYNTQFSQTLQLQDLLSTAQDKATSQANAQRDTSKANITLIMNTLQDTGTSWDNMDSSLKTELQSLGLKAGFSTLQMQAMFNNLGKGEKQVSASLVESASGDYYSILTQKADGTYATSTMPTGKATAPATGKATAPTLTAGEKSTQANKTENTRIKNELTNSGQRDYVSQGYYDQVKASQTLYTATAFDDKFGYLLTGGKLTDDEKKKGLKWLTKEGATQAEKDRFESDGTFQKWVLSQK